MTAKEELRERVFVGAKARWSEVTEDIRERLDFELGVTETLGQTECILMAAHVAAAIHAAGGRIAPGRGACAASAMLYALNVTNLDPLQHDLLFTLFMCLGRKRKMPVLIDTDAKGEVAAHAYLKDTYGEIEVLHYQHDAPHLLKVNDWEIGITHSPAVDRLSEMLDAISTTPDERIDLDRLPNDDPKTLVAFQNGELSDIPYFDSPGIQAALGKVNVTFNELVNIRALVYLEFTKRLDTYLARRRGETEVVFAHPLLQDILGETCGLFIFHEQILLVLHRIGGFTLDEAEICRRVLYMRREKEMAIAFKKFLNDCLANPAFRTEECANEQQAYTIAVSIWNDIVYNSSRTFMKAHAVAIVRLAYILGYLKCHHFSTRNTPNARKGTASFSFGGS